ncbi:hypothetical protein KWI_0103560 [Xanthomonas vasicola pv. vasculorum NCPPB 206]|nr:hypothetical protein KWI_0103560 [Xanthomonas vasicola pv. vasculorum NCPPB 206]
MSWADGETGIGTGDLSVPVPGACRPELLLQRSRLCVVSRALPEHAVATGIKTVALLDAAGEFWCTCKQSGGASRVSHHTGETQACEHAMVIRGDKLAAHTVR